MTPELYDAEHIARFYDEYGDLEWDRLEVTLQGRATHATHTAALERHLPAAARVLEIGAGPGRFTIELARLGASVVVADISPVQLDSHRLRIGPLPAEAAVLDRLVLDIRDLSAFGDEQFEAIVAYGGPLSYVFDHAGDALAEMHRVLMPGGVALMSVMSLLGAARIFRQGIAELSRQFGLELILDRVLATGDLHDERVADNGHRCRMYRSNQIVALVEAAGFEVVDLSASNYLLSEGDGLQVEDPLPAGILTGILAREVEVCREPGVIDAGSHILVVARKAMTG